MGNAVQGGRDNLSFLFSGYYSQYGKSSRCVCGEEKLLCELKVHASLYGFCLLQGQHYHTYELAKNTEPEKEEEEEFQAALAVHPVSDMTLMYRLHKQFSRIQLDRVYQEIQDLQVCGEGYLQKLLDQTDFLHFQHTGGRSLLLSVGISETQAIALLIPHYPKLGVTLPTYSCW